MDLGGDLEEFVEERRIPIFGIASAGHFERALPGWHPRDLMPRCKSLLVFGRPFAPHPLQVDERTHIANESWWHANKVPFRELAKWRGELIRLLDEYGLGAANFGGYVPTSEPTFSYRLAQVEAGVGVFGRSGFCLNPEFGCYYTIGVLLTEARLAPSGRERLGDFSPCDGCRDCADVCPVRAIDASKAPAEGYNRELCMRFILKTRQRYAARAKICARCFSVCPWGNQKRD